MAKKLREYRVTWEMNLYASSAREAAKEALKIQRDLGSLAVVFDIWDDKGKFSRVDLLEWTPKGTIRIPTTKSRKKRRTS